MHAELEVVVPMFRETETLEQLLAALASVMPSLGRAELLLVDDGSGDGTAELCARLLAGPHRALPARLLRHRRNLGLSAALRTAFAAGSAPIVCWLDADLSYDPELLATLAAEIRSGADVALASAYHPDGSVERVPPLRRALSRGLSRAYQLMHRRRPHTWSCMVRAWRRSCLARCLPAREGHLGVTESLVRAEAIGARIVEVPACLRGRAGGKSGLVLVPAILGHVRMLQDAVLGRLGP